MEPTTVPAGATLPAGIISKAKAVATFLTLLVSFASSSVVLAMVPDEHDGKVLAVCGIISGLLATFAVYWTQPKLEQPITIEGDTP